MIDDWCHFDADEREVKAFWADREFQWNRAGDSYYRTCGSRRWSAQQRTRSPPPTHRYPHSPPSSSLRTHRHPSFPSPPSSSSSQTHHHHSFPSLPSSSSSQTHRHHSLSFPPPPSSPKNHPHRDFPNHNYQQNYKSTRLSTSTVSKRSSDLTENGRARGSERFSSLTEKHRCLGSLKEQRGLGSSKTPLSGRDANFQGLTKRDHASKDLSENLLDPAGTRISSRKREQRGGSGDTMHFSDTTANHCGDGGSRFSVPTPTSYTTLELGLPSAPTFTVRREHREAEKNDMLFAGQILNPYSCEHTKPKPNCEKPNLYHKPINNPIKPKPTLPQNQPITLSNMMQFMAEWFEFEENKNVAEDTLIGKEFLFSRTSLEPLIGDHDERKCDDEVMKKQTVAFENVEKGVTKELGQEMDKHDLCTLDLKQDLGCLDLPREEKNALVTLDCDTDCDGFTGFGHEEQPNAEGYEIVDKGLDVMDYGSTVEKASSKIDFGLFETLELVGDSTKLDMLLEGPRQNKFGFGTSEIVQETLAFEDQAIVSPTNFENLVATEMANAWLFTFAASDSIESLGEGQLDVNLTLRHFQLGASFHNVQGCTEEAPIKKPIMVMFRSNHSRQSKLYVRFEVIWKCSLLPLWTFDVVRKDYSVGVYQNHRKKRKKKKTTLPFN